MPNPKIRDHAAAELINKHLNSGALPHPGNPETEQPATLIRLAGFKTTGMPPQLRETVQTTTYLVAEAIVALLEGNGHMP